MVMKSGGEKSEEFWFQGGINNRDKRSCFELRIENIMTRTTRKQFLHILVRRAV